MKHQLNVLKNIKIEVVPAGAVLTYRPLQMALGKNRVAEIKAVKHNVVVAADTTEDMHMWFWRKSAPATFPTIASNWSKSEDVFYHHRVSVEFDTAVGHSKLSEGKMIPFPPGLILVRAPQLVALAAGGVATISLTVYYNEFEVSDAEMSALMIKDHE